MRQNAALKINDQVSPPQKNPSDTVIRFPNSAEPQVGSPGQPATSLVSGLNDVLFNLGIEPSLTIREAAALLRWSHWKARRYFRHVDGICLCYQPKRYKRAYRTFTIPVSIFAREWQKMTGQQPESSHMIRERLLTLVR